MENIFKVFLVLHIAGGSIGLLAGTINMFRTKGDKLHKLAGDFFFYGMLAAGCSALVMSVMHTSYFLFITGVFTIYLVSTGKRYLSMRGSELNAKRKPLDWALTGCMGLFSIAFTGFGIYNLVGSNTFGIVFLVFGYLSMRMVIADVKNYQGKSEIKNAWYVLHFQRMIGAYIAALTAFLVVNVPQGWLPASFNFIPWLLPPLILVPLIYKWTAKYAVKK